MKLQKIITIDHHISAEEVLHPEATGDFTALLHDLTLAIRIITSDVRRAGLNSILGMTNNINVHGEEVRKLDKYANDVIKRVLMQGGHICAMASEEEPDVVYVDNPTGKYIVVFDPLDGSTNIDVNITIGTIFGVYQRLDTKSNDRVKMADILQPGNKLIAAGYALYGSSTVIVYTTGHGVNMFTYDPSLGEFLLSSANIRIPSSGNYYSINEANFYKWAPRFREFVDNIKHKSAENRKPYVLRYVGSGAADIHRTMHYGGIYMYPIDKTNTEGRFRLLYEANPLAYIIENAGGKSSNGKISLLDIIPTELHQKTPLFIGSVDDVDELESFIKDDQL